jgi:hypothetical protein
MATFPNSVTLAGHRGGFGVTVFAAPGRLAVNRQIGPFNASSSDLPEPAAGGTWR